MTISLLCVLLVLVGHGGPLLRGVRRGLLLKCHETRDNVLIHVALSKWGMVMSVASRILACVGTAVVVLSLAACGSSPSVTEGSSNVSDAGAPASDSIDSTDSTDSTPAPAQSGTQNAPNTEPTQGDLQSTRRSWVGVHNESSRLIWVKLFAGDWIDNPPPPVDGWWPIQPGAAFVIVGDGGTYSDPTDISASIKPDGGDGKEYGIYASNTLISTLGDINFAGGQTHAVDPNHNKAYIQVGIIDVAEFVYGREVGGTEFWDVFIRNKT